jgi:hypothetical protein
VPQRARTTSGRDSGSQESDQWPCRMELRLKGRKSATCVDLAALTPVTRAACRLLLGRPAPLWCRASRRGIGRARAIRRPGAGRGSIF